MPELPEVETIRRQLDHALAGRRVVDADASWAKTLVGRGASVEDLRGRAIRRVRRRGKVLVLDLEGQLALLVHLRMTGQLLLRDDADEVGPQTRCVITLDRGALVFNDQRKFGRIVMLPGSLVEADPLLARMGPDALDDPLDASRLARRLSRHRSLSVKAALLDQSTIAGIGNIYADEVLCRAGLHPARRCDSLVADDHERLADAIGRTLEAALAAGGSTMRDYRDATGSVGSYLDRAVAFGRTGAPCRTCATPITKIRVAGRGTHLCPSCQPDTAQP